MYAVNRVSFRVFSGRQKADYQSAESSSRIIIELGTVAPCFSVYRWLFKRTIEFPWRWRSFTEIVSAGELVSMCNGALAALLPQTKRNFIKVFFLITDSPGDDENISIILNGIESELKFITDSTGDKVMRRRRRKRFERSLQEINSFMWRCRIRLTVVMGFLWYIRSSTRRRSLERSIFWAYCKTWTYFVRAAVFWSVTRSIWRDLERYRVKVSFRFRCANGGILKAFN